MPERRRRPVPWPYAIERRRVHGRPVVSLLRHGEQVAWRTPHTQALGGAMRSAPSVISTERNTMQTSENHTRERRATPDELRRAISLQQAMIDVLREMVHDYSPQAANRLRLFESLLGEQDRRLGVLDAPWEIRGHRDPSTVRQNTIAAVERHPEGISPVQLTKETGITLRAAQNRLARAAQAGDIQRIAVGVYAPHQAGEEEE